LAFVFVFFQHNFTIQYFTSIFGTYFSLYYLQTYKPLLRLIDNKLEILGEICLLALLQFFLIFSGNDPELERQNGSFIIFAVLVIIIAHALVAFTSIYI